MGDAQTALIVFVRNPRLGRVKTRLAATVGDDRALLIYQILLSYTRDLARSSGYSVWVFYSDDIAQGDLWESVAAEKRLQQGKDLGASMHRAFTEVLQHHVHAIIIGSDCGMLTTDHLAMAKEYLRYTDVVIGPSHDGGYYLLALKETQVSLFENMAWSTSRVLPDTVDRLLSSECEFGLLETLRDVDTEEDWDELGWAT